MNYGMLNCLILSVTAFVIFFTIDQICKVALQVWHAVERRKEWNQERNELEKLKDQAYNFVMHDDDKYDEFQDFLNNNKHL